MKIALLLIPVVTSTLLLAAETPNHADAGKAWWEHVKVLADDKMEGRDTGSPGMKRAADYVVSKLKESGLQPAGSKGYYQPVTLVKRSLDESRSRLSLVRDGVAEPVKLGDEAFFGTRVDLAPSVDAQLAFVGYGIKVPEAGYDDFAGQDLKGKVLVYIIGAPAEMPPDLASHYQFIGERWKAMKATGAIGAIAIANPAAMDIPWERQKLMRLEPSMRLRDESLVETAGLQLTVAWNPAFADKIFAGTGHTAEELFALVKQKKHLPKIALKLRVQAKANINYTRVESFNIVASLPGTDSELKNEYVVLTAHLDHLGVGEPIAGDPIYNGAMDNASGSAMLLAMADHLKHEKERTRRSLLFIFFTAEEKGLLGSRYFVKRSTVPTGRMVANINIDNFLPLRSSSWFVVRGMNESNLGDWARESVENAGANAQLDPKPQRNAFIRSDQYNFIREGIPAVILTTGYQLGSAEEEIFNTWLRERYHAPSDDLSQPISLETAGKYQGIMANLLLRAANEKNRPAWKSESFFRRFAHAQ